MTKHLTMLLAGSALTLTGCAGGLGGNLPPASEVQPRAITQADREEGARNNEGLLNEFGGAYAGRQAAYVQQVGQKIAFQSGIARNPGDFTVNLLNSPVDNAFAIPGGYIYVTRNLMGLMNNEAELAGVLGHEVGHVAAGHSQGRQSRAQRAGIGGLLGQVLTGAILGNGALGQIAQQGIGTFATAYVAGYSQAQEYQADEFGILYLERAGYDPMALSTMLASLAAQTTLEARQSGNARTLPQWASTHPDPAARVQRARERAQALSPAGAGAGVINREPFLAAIDSMLYDDDPKQGVIRGNNFLHPDLRLRFTAPQGYTMSNSASAVSITGQNGQAELRGAGAVSPSGLTQLVSQGFQAFGQGAPAAGPVQRTTINGVPAAYSTATAQTQNGAVDVGVFAYSLNGQGYLFLTKAPGGQSFGALTPMLQSFAPLSASEAAQIKARVIDVVTVRSGDTVSGFANQMAYDDLKLERFLVLNGLGSGQGLRAGEKVKVIRYR